MDRVLFTAGVVVAVMAWRAGQCPLGIVGVCLGPVGSLALYVAAGCAAWGLGSLIAGRPPRPPDADR